MLGLLLGAHVSIAGGMHNALLEARRLRITCLQVFTKNQRQWRSPPLTREQVQLWQEHRRTMSAPVVAHAGYLINLAGPAGDFRKKSIVLLREELLRCDVLEIPLLVVHPGAHLGSGEEAGLRQVAAALDEVHEDLPGLKLVTCLEITAGAGSHLGYSFAHLRQIIDRVRQPHRLAVCLDTAHLLAAGYDLASAAGLAGVLRQAQQTLGLHQVRAWHLNDSKVPRGARVDRHAHIGHGHIPNEVFAAILKDPHFATVPKVIETPKGHSPGGRSWDALNLGRLRRLAGR
jgi:deoxyribonuclease IV